METPRWVMYGWIVAILVFYTAVVVGILLWT